MEGSEDPVKIRYLKDTDMRKFRSYAKTILRSKTHNLKRIKKCAGELFQFMTMADSFIQKHTEAVCAVCTTVCCINRHAYYEHEDIIYLLSLGLEVPVFESSGADSDPCRFMGSQGCTISRSFRPYRCTWFFCTPLLARMQNDSAVAYRQFIRSLEKMTRKREDMLIAFIDLIRKDQCSTVSFLHYHNIDG